MLRTTLGQEEAGGACSCSGVWVRCEGWSSGRGRAIVDPAGVPLAGELSWLCGSPSPAGAQPQAPTLPCFPVSGASVISTRCSETYETKTALLSLFGIPLWYQSQSPRVILQVGALSTPSHLRSWVTVPSWVRAGCLCHLPCADPTFSPSSQTCTQATAGPSRGPRALLWFAFLPASAPLLSP